MQHGTYESLETEWLEIKPVPGSGNAWNSIRETVGAFLNTRGGIVVLGVRDEQGPPRRYIFTGYTEDNSGNLSELRKAFQDARNNPLDAADLSVLPHLKSYHEGAVASW